MTNTLQTTNLKMKNPIASLAIAESFGQLGPEEKLFSHYLSQAASECARIVCRQVSPESEAIFDLILALCRASKCQWQHVGQSVGVNIEIVEGFLEYAGLFFDSLGNYQVLNSTLTFADSSANNF